MGKLSAILGLAALAGVGFYVGKKIIEKKNNECGTEHLYDDGSDVFVEEKHSSPKEKLQKASLFAVGAIKTGTEKFKEGIDEIINSDMVSKGEETVEWTKTTAAGKKEQAMTFAKEAREKTVDFAKGAMDKTVDFAMNAKDKAVDFAKTAKDKVAAFSKDAAENAENVVEGAAETVEEIKEDAAETVGEIKEEAEEAADAYSEEVGNLKDMVDDINVTAAETEADADDYGTGSSPVEESTAYAGTDSSVIDEAAKDAAGFFEEAADEADAAADDIDSLNVSEDEETIETFDFSSDDRL